jgi:hypothetical protein
MLAARKGLDETPRMTRRSTSHLTHIVRISCRLLFLGEKPDGKLIRPVWMVGTRTMDHCIEREPMREAAISK